jgi:outer membrane protein TolC
MYLKTTICSLMSVGLLLANGTMAQDRPPDVRHITLDEAKKKAAGTATSRLAQLTVDAAQYHRREAEADYFPKLNADFLNLHFNKFMGQTIQLFRRDASLPLFGKDWTAVALTVAQPVTQILQVKQAVTVARADEQIARAKVSQLAAQTSENVERVYFKLLIAQRHQTTAARKVEALESGSLLASNVATSPARSGTERAVSLVEANKELATTESEVGELTESLIILMGFAPGTRLILDIPEPMTGTISLSEATQRAVDNSPDVVEAEQTLVKAKAASRLARLDYVPAVAVVGGYVAQPAQAVIPFLPSDFSFIGFSATLNLFDFGKRENTIRERNAQVGLAEANVAMVKSKVAANVQKSFLDLQRTQKIRDLTRRLAAGYQEASLQNIPATAAVEEEIIQAELDFRSAYAQLKRFVDGR